MASSLVEPSRPVYGPPAALPSGPARVAAGDAAAVGASAIADPRAAEPRPAPAGGPAPDVVVVGAASRDLSRVDPRGWRLGGGATYGALVLARLGVRVGVVLGLDDPASDAHELDLLRDAGAEIHAVRLPSCPVFELTHGPGGRTITCVEPGGPIPVAALPPAWRAAPAWYLAPVADEVPDGWAAIPPGAVVALGWQGILRDLERGRPVVLRAPAPRALLRRADLVSVSVEDLHPATDLRALLRLLRAGTVCTITAGARGGLACTARPGSPRIRYFPSVPSDGAVDTTGAGDAFLAALLAARVAPALTGRVAHLPAALRFAATVAAVHVGGEGLAGVPTLGEVRDALRPRPPG